jgi:hypothetical protein
MSDTAARKGKVSELERALVAAPGVYEVMRLYEQYQKVLDQARAYLVRRSPYFSSFSSSDRTG